MREHQHVAHHPITHAKDEDFRRAPSRRDMKIEIGSMDRITLDKLFGPTIFANLRITADTQRGWVVERQWIKTGEWREWCVIPAQIDEEFDDNGAG